MFLILITGIFIVSSSQENKIKVDKKIYESLEKEKEIRVIIKLNEPLLRKGFLFKIQKTSSEIKSEKQKTKNKIINKIGEKKSGIFLMILFLQEFLSGI